MMDNMTVLSTDTFASYTATNDCLVLFYKSHCPHCKVMMKVLGKNQQTNPEINIVGVDTEQYPTLLETVEVSKVPTVLIYKDGRLVARKSGIMNPAELSALYFGA